MSSKFLKIVCAAMLSVGLIGQVNASLIVGDIVADADGNEWTYVGEFNLIDGPYWNDANDCYNFTGPGSCVDEYAEALNGIQVAELLFGNLIDGLYATSTSEDLVNRLTWYDAFEAETHEASDSIDASVGDEIYSEDGDLSAYIQDRSYRSSLLINFNYVDKLNYVFKSVDVPEPSSLAIFALALCVLGARRFKA